jgi:alpha-ketoglutarate-dependent taurine dioxygenase
LGRTDTLQTEGLTETVGARVLDVDCDRLLNDEHLPGAVMDALEENGVLVFRGLDVDEGRGVLADLIARATTRDRVYRHVWSEGDTVVWDNRGVVRRVTPYDPASRREMHRTTLVGDEPIQ